MTSKKVFYGMAGLLIVMLGLVIGAVAIGDALLRKQSDKLVNLKLEDKVIDAQQLSLSRAKKDVEAYAELGTVAKQIVPQDKDQARAVREIIGIGEQSGIRISSVTFPSSNLGAKKPPSTTNQSESGSSTATKPAANPLTQATAVKGIDGLYQLNINIVSDTSSPATYSQLIDFLERLEQNRRTAQVSQISIQPNEQNRNILNFTLTLTVYIKP